MSTSKFSDIRLLNPRYEIGVIQTALSATFGSIITSCCITPLDVIKTRLQADPTRIKTRKCYMFYNGLMQHLFPMRVPNFDLKRRPNGVIDSFLHITRCEGVGTLWSGLGSTLLSSVPNTVTYFILYDNLKRKMLHIYHSHTKVDDKAYVPFWIALTASLMGRTVAQTISTPIELLRIKKQASSTSYPVIIKQLKHTIATDGLLSLWRPLPSTLMRDCPFSSIYWMCYELIKNNFLKEPHPTILFSIAAGATAGSIGAIATNPMDVVTTRATLEVGEKLIYAESRERSQPTSILQHLSIIYRKYGVTGLFAGIVPRLIRIPISCAIMITIFEHSKTYFYKYNEFHDKK